LKGGLIDYLKNISQIRLFLPHIFLAYALDTNKGFLYLQPFFGHPKLSFLGRFGLFPTSFPGSRHGSYSGRQVCRLFFEMQTFMDSKVDKPWKRAGHSYTEFTTMGFLLFPGIFSGFIFHPPAGYGKRDRRG